MVDFNGFHVDKYTYISSHGSYGLEYPNLGGN